MHNTFQIMIFNSVNRKKIISFSEIPVSGKRDICRASATFKGDMSGQFR